MSTCIEDVEKFILAVGQTVSENNESQALLYRSLILEEYGELQEAFNENDDVEVADAIFDLCWVAIGYAMSRGWDMPAMWAEGAQSNLSKIDPDTGLVKRRPDGKILKPEGWLPPNFAQFV